MQIDKQVKQIKQYIEKMPSLPVTVTKILEICNNPQTSPADLNRVITLDPVLMGKVMKLINSAYYGLSQEITSLVRAIIMLGLNTVKNLALSTAILGTLGNKSNFQALNMDGFWRHSLCVGVTSKLIAKKRGIDPKLREEYFIAGLLHDMGKIPLNNILTDDYLLAMSISDREHLTLHSSETKAIGLNHAEAGKMIIDAWKLSPEINDGVTYHHNVTEYTGVHKDVLFTVTAANFSANYFEIGYSGDRYPEKPLPEVFQYLEIDLDYLEEIEDTVNQEIEKARIFLRLSQK